MKPTTVLVWAETPTKSDAEVVDIAGWQDRALAQRTPRGGQHVHEPVFSEALALGADIVLHSVRSTERPCDVVCGFLVVNDKALAEKLYFHKIRAPF